MTHSSPLLLDFVNQTQSSPCLTNRQMTFFRLSLLSQYRNFGGSINRVFEKYGLAEFELARFPTITPKPVYPLTHHPSVQDPDSFLYSSPTFPSSHHCQLFIAPRLPPSCHPIIPQLSCQNLRPAPQCNLNVPHLCCAKKYSKSVHLYGPY